MYIFLLGNILDYSLKSRNSLKKKKKKKKKGEEKWHFLKYLLGNFRHRKCFQCIYSSKDLLVEWAVGRMSGPTRCVKAHIQGEQCVSGCRHRTVTKLDRINILLFESRPPLKKGLFPVQQMARMTAGKHDF